MTRPQRALLQLVQQRRRAATRQVVRRIPLAGGAAAVAAAERGGCTRPRARCQPRQAAADETKRPCFACTGASRQPFPGFRGDSMLRSRVLSCLLRALAQYLGEHVRASIHARQT